MKIAVLTDSSSYISKKQQEKYQIDVIPIPIIWGNKTYHDLVDIGYEEFYDKLANSEQLPTTSQPSIGEFKKYVEKYISQQYTDLIVIPISSGLSSFYSSVVSIAKEETRINIHPFDCKTTCAGEADAAILAGRLVQAGANVSTIIKNLENLRSTMHVLFMVDDLNHLKRTGRLSNAANFVGTLLKIKPILSMDVQDTGQISAIAKERQYKRAYNHIQTDFSELIKNATYPIQCTIFNALDQQRENQWLSDYRAKFPKVRFDESIIGPVVGVHVGQHAIAMIWCRDINSYFDANDKPLII